MDAGREMPSHAEYRRLRDFHRYFSEEMVTGVAHLEDSTTPSPAVRSATNTSLTAFAQLAALRLDASCALISLIDDQHQYILAEATKSLSLQDDTTHAENDGLRWGCSVLQRQDGLCELNVMAEGKTQPSVLVITDLKDDCRTNCRLAISLNEDLEFYAAVPLMSASGYSIGALCVLDTRQRDGLSPAEEVFLKDLAKTIMNHLALEVLRIRKAHTDSLMTGMGKFLDGKESTQDLKQSMRQPEKTDHMTFDRSTNMSKRHGKHAGNSQDGDVDSNTTPGSARTSSTRNQPSEPMSNTTNNQSDFASAVAGLGSLENDLQATRLALSPETSVSETNTSQGSLQSSLITASTTAMFNRAAKALRDASDADGVVFFDASVGGFGEFRHDGTPSSSDLSASSNDELAEPPSARPGLKRLLSADSGLDQRAAKMCNILSFSTANSSSLSGAAPPADEIKKLSEVALKHLLRRYGSGHVFHVYEKDIVTTTDEECDNQGNEIPPKTKRAKLRRAVADDLIHSLPGAQMIILLPLWDFARQRYFAGGFIWAKSPAKVRNLELDMNFFTAFGNSIMMELSRLDMAVSDHVKETVISSISHELRSPLQGIMGSAEVLRPDLNETQQAVLDTIDECGRTLLDTIEHLLDFSKVNRKIQVLKTDGRSRLPNSRLRQQSNGREGHESLDLAKTLEELIRVAKVANQQNRAITGRSKKLRPKSAPARDLTLLLTIEKRDNWSYMISPGVWKVILANLIGNAFKYTDNGFISIKLEVREGKVYFVVADTGRGMSAKFLNNSLYAPFTQEDPNSVGAGLGLSIVRRTVRLSGGWISFRSVQGQGTTVTVQLPLVEARVPTVAFEADNFLPFAVRARLATDSWTICFLDETNPKNFQSHFADIAHRPALRSSFAGMVEDWFGMKYHTQFGPPKKVYQIFVIDICASETSSRALEVLEERSSSLLNELERIPDKGNPFLIVLCPDQYLCQRAMQQSDQARERYSKRKLHVLAVINPIGPYKLARMMQSYHAWAERNDLSIPATTDIPYQSEADIQGEGRLSPENLSLQAIGNHSEVSTHLAPPETVPSPESTNTAPSPNPEATEFRQPEGPTTPNTDLVTPLSWSSNWDRSPMSPHEAATPSVSLHILLVEDNPINMKVLTMAVAKTGHTHDMAENGLEAVQKFESTTQPYDVILTDISMPIMDGLEATRRIRAMERKNSYTGSIHLRKASLNAPSTQTSPAASPQVEMKSPMFERESFITNISAPAPPPTRSFIIALTGVGSADVQHEAYSSGVDLFLTKPYGIKKLRELINSFATKKAAGIVEDEKKWQHNDEMDDMDEGDENQTDVEERSIMIEKDTQQ